MPTPLDEFDQVYRLFAAHLGWHPRDVDRLEVWEAARLLGKPEQDTEARPVIPATRLVKWDDSNGARVTEGGGSSMGDQLQVQRVLAARSRAATDGN